MSQNNQTPRFFAVTTPGLSATRWLAYVLAAHPDVYVAHGRHALDSVLRGQYTQEQQIGDIDSLVCGNAMRGLYDDHSLEEVYARYRQSRPQARVFGCVHSYTLDSLIRAARSPRTLSNLRILNLVRHPINYIASHYALVRSAEKYPRLYRLYADRVIPQALREFPELFLMPCSDARAFLAFAASCFGMSNLIRDLAYPGVRSVRMEALTTRMDLLQSICRELTGYSYPLELLQNFISQGAVNQHRPPGEPRDPHAIFAGWEPWQQDMVHMMLPGTVLDWLEELDYDVTMLSNQVSTWGTSKTPSGEPLVPCLADHLRILDQRHPYLEYVTHASPSAIRFIEAEHRSFKLVHREGQLYALAKIPEVQDPSQLAAEAIPELEAKGMCFCADTVAEAWIAIARNLCPCTEEVNPDATRTPPQLIEEGFKGFNLIAYEGRMFALDQNLGPMDLASLPAARVVELSGMEQVHVADSLEEAKRWVEELQDRLQPRSLEPPYRGFNLVAYRGSIWAVAHTLEQLDLVALEEGDLEDHQRADRIFLASSVEEARRWIDRIKRPLRRRILSRLYRLTAGRP